MPHAAVPGSTHAELSALASHTPRKMPQSRCPIKPERFLHPPQGDRRWPPSRAARRLAR
jgi:hypothetical protein